VTNTSVTNGVTIDVYQNKLRFFEQGGSARGYYIDITAGGSGATTALTGGGGGGTVTSITASSPLTGGTITGSGTIGINASSLNTANYVVQRDADGNFSANTITANIALANVTGLGSGVSTFLATPTSANLRSAVTDETGTGNLVFSTSPSLTTPDIGAATGTSLNVTGQIVSTASTGTAPLAVSSTTQVANLNAAVSGIALNLSGGSSNKGELVYQSDVNTTSELSAPTTNNSMLAYNTATNAPYWIQTTLSNTYYAATTSSQLANVISDETGTGALVFATNPTMEGITLNNASTMIVRDTDSTVGRIIGSSNVFYIQAGADSADATGHIFLGRTASSSAAANITLNATTTNVAADMRVGANANVVGTFDVTGAANIGGTNTTNVRIMTRRVWISNTAPSGTNTTGDVWISW
jgi:hypothetical protein